MEWRWLKRAYNFVLGNLVLVLVLVLETKGLSLRTKETAFIEIALLLFLMITSQSTAAEDK